jgi:demethylmenaquinone methyltransferase/2-methoxy-6-polyprenyl-1,4-benzoquinol methylase
MGVIALLRTGKGPMDGWIARAYDRGVQKAFRGLVASMLEELSGDLGASRRLLDVGCGPGQFSIMAAERLAHAEVVGVDLAPTMIELARGHAAASAARARLRFELGDAMALPFGDAEFDTVLSSGSIKQWPDAARGMAEMHRVLAPGGRAFVLEVNRDAPAAAVERQRRELRHWLFRLLFPRVVTQGMSPAEARQACLASPFGAPEEERLLLDGLVWLLAARKAPA